MSYWYCPNCKIELDGCHVTYEEKCEYCGSDVLFVPETISQEELDELIKAKAEGRLMMLPCKVGDNVYFLLQELDGEWYVSSPHRITEIGTRGFWTSAFPLEKPNAMDDFTSWSEFGKTVFLTKEEAEKALEVIRRVLDD